MHLEIDAELPIHAAIDNLAIQPTFFHVKGHQDDNTPIEDLPWTAQLNIRCNQIASHHLELAMESLPEVPMLPASTISLSIGKQTVTSHVARTVRELVELPA